ncbi:hypothetical protein JCM10212_004320 [Sporobolomyces blumeae]
MLLPHRTAWTTPVEFHAVFSDLFESDGDLERQATALSRIAVWQSRSTCPHAVESTANLVRLILVDADPSRRSSSKPSVHELRLSYSMAIIRFVNSLVDPLQTAYFARSISSLAAQLGLPLWFVELRHQATHEDLPSLAVLRQGARQGLDWLYSHYWLPTLSASSSAASSSSSTLPPLPLEPFVSALSSYKTLLKSLHKDASQAGKIKNELGARVWRELERWAVENGISTAATSAVTGHKRKSMGNAQGKAFQAALKSRVRERAIEAVVGVLVDQPGWLVPLAKKKRPSTRSPSLPPALVELYTPLLDFLDESLFAVSTSSTASTAGQEDEDSDSFLEALMSRLVEILCDPSNPPSSPAPPSYPSSLSTPSNASGPAEPSLLDASYFLTLQAWVLHLLPLPSASSNSTASVDPEAAEAIEAVVKTCLIAATPTSIALVEAVVERCRDTDFGTQLEGQVRPLLQMVRNRDSGFSAQPCSDDPTPSSHVPPPTTSTSHLSSPPTGQAMKATTTPTISAKRWRLIDPSSFNPSPIGALPLGGYESLDLAPPRTTTTIIESEVDVVMQD